MGKQCIILSRKGVGEIMSQLSGIRYCPDVMVYSPWHRVPMLEVERQYKEVPVGAE